MVQSSSLFDLAGRGSRRKGPFSPRADDEEVKDESLVSQQARTVASNPQQAAINNNSLIIDPLFDYRAIRDRKRTSCPLQKTNESPAASTPKASLTSSARSARKSSRGSPSFASCPAISSTSITQSASGPGSKSRMRAHSASKRFQSMRMNCKALLPI